MKIIPVLGVPTHFGAKVKRDYVVFSLLFPIGPQTAISMERARRELSIDMDVCGPIWKTGENTTDPFYFRPKISTSVPKTGIIFISAMIPQLK